jgi:hypothetical protein
MSTNTYTNPTLLDVVTRQNPQGGVDVQIAELMSKTNEIMDEMTMVECNDGTTHLSTVRTGLPAGAWRKLNYGVPSEKSQTIQVRDGVGMLESYGEIDVKLARINGNSAGWRLTEESAFVEGLGQTMAATLVYGDTDTNPERFLGIAPRYDLTTAGNGDNIILGGSADTDNTSIYLVGWSPSTVFGLFPKGSSAGLKMTDLGEDTAVDSNGLKHQVLRTHFEWDLGFCVKDWRYIVRICNIEKSALLKDAASGADIVDLMDQALEIVPRNSGVRWAFYCNRTISSFLRRQVSNKAKYQLTLENFGGKPVTLFSGVPVRRVDAIVNNETLIA